MSFLRSLQNATQCSSTLSAQCQPCKLFIFLYILPTTMEYDELQWSYDILVSRLIFVTLHNYYPLHHRHPGG